MDRAQSVECEFMTRKKRATNEQQQQQENEHTPVIVIEHDKFPKGITIEKIKGEQTFCTHSIYEIAMSYNLMFSLRFVSQLIFFSSFSSLDCQKKRNE